MINLIQMKRFWRDYKDIIQALVIILLTMLLIPVFMKLMMIWFNYMAWVMSL